MTGLNRRIRNEDPGDHGDLAQAVAKVRLDPATQRVDLRQVKVSLLPISPG